MRHIDNIQIGKCYEFYDEPAKVIDFDLTVDDQIQVVIAYGRGFEEVDIIFPSKHNYDIFPELGLPWNEYRAQQRISIDCNKQAKRMDKELRRNLQSVRVCSEVNYNDWGSRGEIVIQGELAQLMIVLSQLEGGA